MPHAPDLMTAFADALRKVERALAADMRTRGGEPARPRLERLRDELLAARDGAVAGTPVDAAWVGLVVRDVAGWAPESDVELIAGLGRIARAARGAT